MATRTAASVVAVHPIDWSGPDMWHDWSNAMTDWNKGAMNGFDQNTFATDNQPDGLYPYAFLKPQLVQPYWTMAKTYTLADRMFATEFGPSFTSHLNLIAGTTNLSPQYAEVDGPSTTPWYSCDAPPEAIGRRCSRRSERSKPRKGRFRVSRSFARWPIRWTRSTSRGRTTPRRCARRAVCGRSSTPFATCVTGPDWNRNVLSPQTRVLTDAKTGHLPAVSWVIPDSVDSDHVGGGSTMGPEWVSSVVNAIGTSADWNSTAIVVVWDEWGGWYDSVPPPQLDARGLGFRVPCVI